VMKEMLARYHNIHTGAHRLFENEVGIVDDNEDASLRRRLPEVFKAFHSNCKACLLSSCNL
jgi:hypothetical protein